MSFCPGTAMFCPDGIGTVSRRGTSDATVLLSDARCWLRLAVPGCCIARRCHGIV